MNKNLGMYVRSGAPSKKKFDMTSPPTGQNKFIMPFAWGYCNLRRMLHLEKVEKVRMEGVKPPYIMLCNHNSFYDFYVMESAIAPTTGVFPAAVDDFIGREPILRALGGVPKRKYTADIGLLRTARTALKNDEIFGIYAEARYSLCGLTEVIPDAIGQLIKHQKVPVVVLNCKGHHIYDPFWGNHRHRRIFHMEARMEQLLTPDEVKALSIDEINDKVRAALYNDDFRWQSKNRIKVTYKKRAEGLHKVLYQCPNCMTEYKMNSKGDTVFCEHCGKSWKLNEYGELEGSDGKTEFKFPTDWYKWEREQVKKEIEDGSYHFECNCHVNDLPNSMGFVRLGNAHFVHDMNGFHLHGTRDYDGEPFEMEIDSAGQYALHVEYDYRFGQHKDCIDLNTIDDTWYVFPDNCEFSPTKLSLATEEIYNYIWKKRKEENSKK